MISETFFLKGKTPKKLRYESELGQQSAFGGLYLCKTAFDGEPPYNIQVTVREVK